MLNIKFEKFKKTHKKKINQVLYYKLKSNNSKEVENLINNFLQDKNSFIFESVEKGIIKGRYTIFGKNPDKIWEFNNKNSFIIQKNKKKRLKDKPEDLIEKYGQKNLEEVFLQIVRKDKWILQEYTDYF